MWEGGTYQSANYSGSYTASSRLQCVGQIYYVGNYGQPHDIAGCSFFNTALSSSDLASGYANDKAEAAIAVPTPFAIY